VDCLAAIVASQLCVCVRKSIDDNHSV